jgi:hypothetical protein
MKEAIQTPPFPVKGGALDRLPALPENEKGIWQFTIAYFTFFIRETAKYGT